MSAMSLPYDRELLARINELEQEVAYLKGEPLVLLARVTHLETENKRLQDELATAKIRTRMALIAERTECINIMDEAIRRIHARGEAQRDEPT